MSYVLFSINLRGKRLITASLTALAARSGYSAAILETLTQGVLAYPSATRDMVSFDTQREGRRTYTGVSGHYSSLMTSSSSPSVECVETPSGTFGELRSRYFRFLSNRPVSINALS
ncbi:hypothetical protein J6590_090232 [Homalodisca vitripennis]|nr:hypothetical protein J6590_090232 [Homalodisca vitripennis]